LLKDPRLVKNQFEASPISIFGETIQMRLGFVTLGGCQLRRQDGESMQLEPRDMFVQVIVVHV